MKNASRTIVILVLAALLAGCALGGRVRDAARPAQSLQSQSQPAAPAAVTGGDPGQSLLNQLDTLEAANQAGDVLEDLP